MKPFFLFTVATVFALGAGIVHAHSSAYPDEYKYEPPEGFLQKAKYLKPAGAATCVDGSAGGYSCLKVDLISFTPNSYLGAGSGYDANDIWGWTDPQTGKEIAILGRTNGTSFIDVSDPSSPLYLGFLPTHSGTASWRDIKVYQNHAFIVADVNSHGMQVFDLTQFRTLTNPPNALTETAYYGEFGNAHNIVINEDTGYAYAVGSNSCSAGLHMIDIKTPTIPKNAGCFSNDGYTHDAQCVVYQGPDTTHQNKEICFAYNEDTLTIVDVTQKSSPVQLSRVGYSNSQYVHQGWLTPDHRYAISNDELDERRGATSKTTTLIWDVSDLDQPKVSGQYQFSTGEIDHNAYYKDGFFYETNYLAGLRILSAKEISQATLEEVAYFDTTTTGGTGANFAGTWSSYIYFPSGNIVLSDIGQGLFVVKPQSLEAEEPSFCSSSGTSVADEWIAGITIGDTHQSSGASSSGYTNYGYGSEMAKLAAGKSYPLTLIPTYSNSSYPEGWKVWIDFNGDRDFDDAGEEVFSSEIALGVQKGTLSIPDSIASGDYRLRVSMKYKGSPTSCENFAYGEVEDYTINIDPQNTGGEGTSTKEETQVILSGSLSNREMKHYGPYPVTAGSNLNVTSTTTSGDPDLYVRFGSPSTYFKYDCRPYKTNTTEVCNLTVPSGQTQAYVSVRSFQGSSYQISITYK